jgi:hypothetical protein
MGLYLMKTKKFISHLKKNFHVRPGFGSGSAFVLKPGYGSAYNACGSETLLGIGTIYGVSVLQYCVFSIANIYYMTLYFFGEQF